MSRDNFSQKIKLQLASRAGNKCSFPGCNASTAGPSKESNSATASTGEAAHIAAASSGVGSRRYDRYMSSAQRSAIDNGIWCCNIHATLIDKDEVIYTIRLLKQWRALAEQRAQIRQAHPSIDLSNGHISLHQIGLAPDTLAASSQSNLHEQIGVAVLNSCIAEIAGKSVADSLRDFLIEHTLNALSHGGASEVKIIFTNKGIEVIDKGKPFALTRLIQANSNGGGLAYRALLHTLHIASISSIRTSAGENHVYIPFVISPRDLPTANPCAIAIDREQMRSGQINFTQLIACDRVYFVAPDFSCYSDGLMYELVLKKALQTHSNIALVFPNISQHVLEHFKKIFAPAEVLSW